jgi:hypothetical protein
VPYFKIIIMNSGRSQAIETESRKSHIIKHDIAGEGGINGSINYSQRSIARISWSE